MAITAVTIVPSYADEACGVKFVSGTSISGDPVCIPLTDEVVEIITDTPPADENPEPEPTSTATPTPSKTASPSPSDSPSPRATHSPVVAPSTGSHEQKTPSSPSEPRAEFVNSDNGNSVTVDAYGDYIDTVEKVAIRPAVVVAREGLTPDDAAMKEVRDRAQELAITSSPPAPSPSPTASAKSTTTTTAVAPAPSTKSIPSSSAAIQVEDSKPNYWLAGVILSIVGVVAIVYGLTSLLKNRDPRHGRRRATA